MFFRKLKAKLWAKKQTKKNLKIKVPIDCKQYIHESDKSALEALKKIPLMDTICSKIVNALEAPERMLYMASCIHITEKQSPKIYKIRVS